MTTEAPDLFSVDHFAVAGARAFALAGLGHDVIYNTVLGLRSVLQITEHEDVSELSELLVKLLKDAAIGAVPFIAAEIDAPISAERAGVGMGAATGLIALFGKPRELVTTETTFDMVMDRIDHVALFAAELDILSRRQSIEARGDVLRQAVRVRQFIELDRFDDTSIN